MPPVCLGGARLDPSAGFWLNLLSDGRRTLAGTDAQQLFDDPFQTTYVLHHDDQIFFCASTASMLLSIVWALFSLLSLACQHGAASKPSGTVLLEDSADNIDATTSRLDVDKHQYEELFAKALAPHTRGSACYKDVVQTFYDVEAHQFSTDDSIRKRGAIALFLCDAEADSIAVPRECNIGAQGQPSAVGVLDWDDYGVQACIHALYRTPQLWASFDNHRKVFPLLLVIQRQRNGVDEAREIYSEIAQQQQRFLSYASSIARKHAQETEELLAQSAGAIQQLHQTLIGTLAHGSGILRGLSEEITANMSILHAELVNVTSVRIFSSIDDKMNSALKELRKNHESSTETALLRAIDAIRVALIRANSEIANDRASVQKMVAHDGPVATLLDNFGQQQTLAFAASRTHQIELESQNGQLHQAISNLRGVIQEVYRFDAKRRELLEEEIVSKRRSVEKARPLLLSLMPDIASERDDIDWTGERSFSSLTLLVRNAR
ncbi:hypothetical protein OC845_004904 [Tilletia horrida]|nr:hypothetical protein OC845_004904 [Tilletia horrida]